MERLAFGFLWLVHLAYACYNASYALLVRYGSSPQALTVPRRQTPKHLAILLTSDEGANIEDIQYVYERSVRDVTRWCRTVGITRLSAYDPQGVLQSSSDAIYSVLKAASSSRTYSRKTSLFPLTPPESDYSGSRPLSPVPNIPQPNLGVSTMCIPLHPIESGSSRGFSIVPSEPFTLHILSPASSTPAIADVARCYVRVEKDSTALGKRRSSFDLSAKELEGILEGDNGVPAPDLVIVHHCSPAKRSRSPLELHGFPPWQIRLSEIHHDEYAATYWRWLMPWRRRQVVTLSEAKFRLALDDYASAEMRLGK